MAPVVVDGLAELAAYLPRVALEWPDTRARWRGEPGTLVFADVSGFTALSEKLARRGSIGAEELTQTLGTVFGRMLDSAYALGGSLLKFGGDALLLLFEGEDHPARAARAAQELRRSARRMGQLDTPVGKLRIRVSVGVHSGEVLLFLVGASHRELLVAGPTASRTVEMESAASAGQILLSPVTASHLDSRVLDAELGPGILLSDRGGSGPTGTFPEVRRGAIDVESCVPAALRQHLRDEARSSEHRNVAIAFVKYSGVDQIVEAEGVRALADRLECLVTEAQAACDLNDVSFLATDVDRDGGKIVLTAGAPKAHPDDTDRLLAAARQILDSVDGLSLRIGAHRGKVFAGDIGPLYRRTYTVMGDVVNTAARVMSAAAAGELLATPVMIAQARSRFEELDRRSITAKGKAASFEVVSLGAASASGLNTDLAAEAVPLVGRDAEMNVLAEALDAARHGTGAAVEIMGPAGSGKSRLMAELCARADDQVRQVVAAADPYLSTTPWAFANRVLRAALGDEDAADADLAGYIAEVAPALLPRVSLLADVLHLPLPADAQDDELDPRVRRRRTLDAAQAVLDALCPGPTLLVMEDLQWADDASFELVGRIVSTAGQFPRLVAVSRRDEGGTALDAPATVLSLGTLSDDEAAALVRAASSDPLRPREVAGLVRHGGGNPLFLIELASSGVGRDPAAELPDSVHSAFAWRIDALPPEDARLLRSASVLGQEFDPRDLVWIGGPSLPSAADLKRRWGDLVTQSGHRLRFRSPLAHEAAYDALPHRRRRELHGQAAEAILGRGGVESEQNLSVLSLHLHRAQRYSDSWVWSRRAGEGALRLFANVEAAQLFEQAIAAGRRLEDLSQSELAEAWRRLADSWHRAGYFDPAEAAYRQARRLLDDPVEKARILMREARIAEMRGRPVATVRRIRRGISVLGDSRKRAAAALRADLAVMHGWVSQTRGDHQEAVAWAERALAEALAGKNHSAKAEALLLREWISVQRGRPVRTDQAEEALRIFEEVGDLSRAAFTLNLLGALSYYRGDWDSAGRYYRRALDAYEQAGNEADAAQARYNAAEILLDQGRLNEAEDVLSQVFDLYRSVGYKAGLGLVIRDRGRIASMRGEFAPAREYLWDARGEFTALQASSRVAEVDAWLADLDLREGRPQDALDRLQTALEQAGEGSPVTPLLLRLRGYALLRLERVDEAETAFAASLDAARAAGAFYDVALGLYANAELARARGAPAPPEIDSERDELFARLGIVAAPTPLGGGPAGDELSS